MYGLTVNRTMSLSGHPSIINKIRWSKLCNLDTFQDFLIKLAIKPHIHTLEISIFSLHHVIVSPTKIMKNHFKDCNLSKHKSEPKFDYNKMDLSKLSRANFDQKKKNLLEQFLSSLHCNNLSPLPNSYDSRCLSKIFGFGIFSIIGIFQRERSN